MTPQEHVEQCKALQNQFETIQKTLQTNKQDIPQSLTNISTDLQRYVQWAETNYNQLETALQQYQSTGLRTAGTGGSGGSAGRHQS